MKYAAPSPRRLRAWIYMVHLSCVCFIMLALYVICSRYLEYMKNLIEKKLGRADKAKKKFATWKKKKKSFVVLLIDVVGYYIFRSF